MGTPWRSLARDADEVPGEGDLADLGLRRIFQTLGSFTPKKGQVISESVSVLQPCRVSMSFVPPWTIS